MVQYTPAQGVSAFTIIRIGQFISLIGSGLTNFAIGVWVYQRTESVTLFSSILLSYALPGIVISPLAGALVDRWNYRWTMILGDSGAAVCTAAFILLFYFAHLEVWHICLIVAISSILDAFQRPAYTASTTLLVPKKHLGRANGIVQVAQAVSQIIAPVLAGVLIVTITVQGVFLIDLVTYLFALSTLLIVRIPQPQINIEDTASQKKSLLREIAHGWTYIVTRPGAIGLLIFFAITNFSLGLFHALLTPLVLSFSSAGVLGVMFSVASGGILAGGILMSLWGGPKRRVNGVLGFGLLFGIGILLAGLRPSALLIAIAVFSMSISTPIVNGCTQTILQTKTPPHLQGRVFAIGSMIAWSSIPLAYFVAGPLADKVFKSLLIAGEPLAESLGQIIGVGPGRGIGLLFMVIAIFPILAAVGGYLYPRLRLLEDEIPDAIVESAS